MCFPSVLTHSMNRCSFHILVSVSSAYVMFMLMRPCFFLTFQGLNAGSLHFPGTASSYQGQFVMHKEVEPQLYNYKNETAWRENTDKVMSWFRDKNVDFVSFYFGEPDGTGHRYGPDSNERREMVKQVDRTVGYIRQSAERHGLTHRLNIIITSDHGMSTVYRNGLVEEITLSKIPGFSFGDLSFHLVDYGPSGMLSPKPGRLEAVYNALKGAHPHLHVYKKEDVPEHLRFTKNDRILPIILWADPGYVINGVRWQMLNCVFHTLTWQAVRQDLQQQSYVPNLTFTHARASHSAIFFSSCCVVQLYAAIFPSER